MSPAQRRIVLAMLVGLLAFVATLEPSGGVPLAPEWLNFGALWMGLYLTSLSFVATWLALSPRPLVERLPEALGLGALLGLAEAWSRRYSSETSLSVTMSLLVPLLALVPVMGVMGIWRRRGWRIALGREDALSPGAGRQFSLRQMCAWMAGTAVILALARWIEPPHSNTVPVSEALLDFLMFGGVTLGSTVLGLPLMVSCVGLVLAEHGRRRFAFWAAALALVVGGLLFSAFLLLLEVATLKEPLLTGIARMAPAMAGSFELGLLAVALGALAVLRACGYRLIRLKNRVEEGSATPEGTPPADAFSRPALRRRWWQSPFPYVVVAMAGVAGVLCWPAWRFDAAKREEALQRNLMRELEDVRTESSGLCEGGVHVAFSAGQPVPAAALTMLTQPTAAQGLISLGLAGTAFTDEQMQCLSGLRSLKHLDLADNGITDVGLERLRGLIGLEELSLHSAQVTDAGMEVLAELKGLRELDLRGTRITDAGLARLHALRRLEHLSLSKTAVTAQGVAKVREALPKCWVTHTAP